MPRRTKEQALQTRNDILQSALDLFDEKGYNNTTLVHIAERIGLTKGAVYWHFKSKQDVFISLIADMDKRFDVGLIPLAIKVRDLRGLKQFLCEYVSLIIDDPQLSKFFNILEFKIEWTDEFSKATDLLTRQDEELFDFVQSILEIEKKAGTIMDIDHKAAAIALIAMVDGLVFDALCRPNAMLKSNVDLGIDIFFRGLKRAVD